ncbi:MAG: ABC transporter ATP-binding protein [Pseudomonadota bacterium]
MSGTATQSHAQKLTMFQFFRIFFKILAPESNFYIMALIYGVGISLLSLATPISVQMLINTVANTALTAPLVLLSGTLFILLMFSGLLSALRTHLMELFGRRFYSRMVAEISVRSVYAQNPFFGDQSRSALFNRYFDIVVVQKSIPVLFIGGFTVILQAGVGMVLVSLYHPYFMVFNFVLIALIWLIWIFWGASAIRSAIDLSHVKHNGADWLERLGSSDGFFKSKKRVDFALEKSDASTCEYVTAHKKHFRRHFAQNLSFLTVYAGASAVLLGLGGWLVIIEQLTLGQLVAAELVLSVAFAGIAQLGWYLTYFYDLCASVEELSLFFDVEQEDPVGDDPIADRAHVLDFHQVRGEARGRPAVFDLEVPSGAVVMAAASNHGVQRLFTNLLKRHDVPQGGYITIASVDLLELDVHRLRHDVFVVDRASFVGMTIREYLKLADDDDVTPRMIDALETVGLTETIAELENGLDTEIATTGWPLSTIELMQLKLAAAILARPRVMILNHLFDLLDEDDLARAIRELRDNSNTTVICFSNRRADLGFEAFLYLENEQQDRNRRNCRRKSADHSQGREKPRSRGLPDD